MQIRNGHLKQANAFVGTQETMEIKEPSMKKGKKKVANSIKLDVCANRVKVSRAKWANKKLSLSDAIHQENSMPLKTKLVDVKAMYKTLKEGLRRCFPYIQDPIPAKG